MQMVMPIAITFAAVLFAVIVAFLWQMDAVRKAHHAEKMELIKLFKASSLSEFVADKKMPAGTPRNHVQADIERSYRDYYQQGDDTD